MVQVSALETRIFTTTACDTIVKAFSILPTTRPQPQILYFMNTRTLVLLFAQGWGSIKHSSTHL